MSLKLISQKFKNDKLKKIVNLYQKNHSGFGDYLRGCYSMYQVSKILGLEFDMDLSDHPMAKFLENHKEKNKEVNYGIVPRFGNDNYEVIDSKRMKTKSVIFLNEMIGYLNNINSETHCFFSNAFPVFPNFNKIKYEPREFIRNKLMPNQLMKQNIELRMKTLGVKEKQFCIIHVRCGDSFILKNDPSINTKVFEKIYRAIDKNVLLDPTRRFVLLSDNNQMKLLLKKQFPQLIVQIRELAHLGESSKQTDTSIMHTLLDFYTMSNSRFIISLSASNWGSGFSEWCAVTYSIPYLKIVY